MKSFSKEFGKSGERVITASGYGNKSRSYIITSHIAIKLLRTWFLGSRVTGEKLNRVLF